MRKQTPVLCTHCDKTFKSGAGVALHMRQVNGTHTRGNGYSPEGLVARQNSIREVGKKSPSGRKAGQRFTLTCARPECNTTFMVVESKLWRQCCSKKCMGLVKAASYTKEMRKAKSEEYTEERRLAASKRMKERYRKDPTKNPFYGRTPANYLGWGHGGYCEELGFSVRSTWERDYLLALKCAKIPFEYEPKRYDLKDGRGTYMPDIKLNGQNIFVEITGWDKPGKAEKRKFFKEVYGWPLYVWTEKPTFEAIQRFVVMCQEVMQPNDYSSTS